MLSFEQNISDLTMAGEAKSLNLQDCHTEVRLGERSSVRANGTKTLLHQPCLLQISQNCEVWSYSSPVSRSNGISVF